MDREIGATLFYDVLKNGCLDILVGTTELSGNLRGDDGADVAFSFNAFTFSSSGDPLYLRCNIALCALDSNGDFIKSNCGWNPSTIVDDCVAENADKQYGYTPAASLT